jgi:hypothetical protein
VAKGPLTVPTLPDGIVRVEARDAAGAAWEHELLSWPAGEISALCPLTRGGDSASVDYLLAELRRLP